MPILEIELITDVEPEQHLAQKIANSVGAALRADKGTVWVLLRTTATTDYAENNTADAPSPVFVKVIRAELPGPVELATEAKNLALTVGKACGVDALLVHIVYEPAGVGRVAFGGTVLE